ncbi:Holliday junction branch migration protein RuvA [candidate division WS5 bacterium]|uniref:Holliday junction branch migration complex subunit RuvA n=1 Tax=candidate division WS5 bacterium TaxID=2093353 RepID=A0A419DG24_9BACT|nr:MAG: Holliday junction branch migration protein RuvA [candidate division WS5 bacterium]
MIASLRGKVVQKRADSLVVEMNGVGYKVICPVSVLEQASVSEEIFLNTYTHVREDILALYGFLTADDLALFELLIGVSGVGPKAAVNILSAASSEKIRASIQKQDPGILYSVSGIGKKTAEKIVVELKNKLGADDSLYAPSSETDDLYQALTDLGFKAQEISAAVSKIPDSLETTEEKLKFALKEIKK